MKGTVEFGRWAAQAASFSFLQAPIRRVHVDTSPCSRDQSGEHQRRAERDYFSRVLIT